MTDEARMTALRGALTELLLGYNEVGRIAHDLPEQVREPLLAPLRRAADSAAAALAQS